MKRDQFIIYGKSKLPRRLNLGDVLAMHDTHYVVTRVDTSTSPIRYTLRTGRRKLILTMKLIKGNENVIYHERPSSEPSEIEERISSLIDPIYSCSYYRDNIVTITSNDRRSWG